MRRFLLFAAVLLASVTLHAQVTTPDAPYQTSLARNPPLNPALPSVFIVGDSMARNGSDLGWGDHFAPLFATSRINVANRTVAAEARAPVSTKDAGRLFWLNSRKETTFCSRWTITMAATSMAPSLAAR